MAAEADLTKLLQIAVNHFNSANPTTPVTLDKAQRAVVNLLISTIATGAEGTAFSVATLATQPVNDPI